MKYLALLLLLFVGGCNLPGTREKYDRTPGGWHVHWMEEGTLGTGLHTRDQVFALFDAAMERSFPECAAKVGLPEAFVRKTIHHRDALYTLYDDSMFRVSKGSADAADAEYASGLEAGRTHSSVAFYQHFNALPGAVPVESPAWTIHPHPTQAGYVVYGLEVDGQQYPALGYELHWQFTDIP